MISQRHKKVNGTMELRGKRQKRSARDVISDGRGACVAGTALRILFAGKHPALAPNSQHRYPRRSPKPSFRAEKRPVLRCAVELLRQQRKSACGIYGNFVATALHHRAAVPFALELQLKPPRVMLPGERSEHSGSRIWAASSLHHFVKIHPPAGKAVTGRFAVPWAV